MCRRLPLDRVEVCYHPGKGLSDCDCRKPGPGMLLRGAGGLACVFFLFIPARRRRGLLSLFIVTVAALSLAACDGGSGTSGSSTSATSAGTYTVAVTGSASGYSSVIAQISVTVQ